MNTTNQPTWLSETGGPKSVSQLDMAFGAAGSLIGSYLPPMSEIPEEFKTGHGYWNKMASQWFFSGAKTSDFTAKEGIDKNAPLRQLSTCLGSFEPAHEHKEAGCAYLMSLFFVEPDQEQSVSNRSKSNTASS